MATIGDLSDEDFAKVATPTSRRITFEEARKLLDAEATYRPRVYLYWHDQIVRAPSLYYLDKYEEDARAVWYSTTTISDLVRKA